MRSPAEILFRVRQEIANLVLLRKPPRWNPQEGERAFAGPWRGLPDPERVAEKLRGTSYAADVERLAEEILAHRIPLLGFPPSALGDSIHWRRDCVSGKEIGTDYQRRIPYLDFARVGDHKTIWELNRHQHLVLLAQAYRITGRREFLDEIPGQLTSWMAANPFQRGINWASALEVAFRGLSWMWVLHLVGRDLADDFRLRWMESLYQHGVYLENNLSIYFSPNTHLLGEGVALHALGQLFPRAKLWREKGSAIVIQQMDKQVRDDGSHFEQSSYYHLYAVDLFQLHLVLSKASSDDGVPARCRQKLERMLEYLDALVSLRGILPLIGDEDGGRVFHPYGDRRHFAEATLATGAAIFGRREWVRQGDGEKPSNAMFEQAAWWVGPNESNANDTRISSSPASSRWFSDAGVAVLWSEGAHIIVRNGAFGWGTAGHSHADALSIVAFQDGAELLIDPATFSYVSDPAARERYRGVAAHNTICVRGTEQATAQGPFRWSDPPEVEQLFWLSGPERDVLVARARYGGFTHRRSVVFQKPDVLVVLDRVDGPPGEHTVEQRWLSPLGTETSFLETFPLAVSEAAERSRAFGSSEPAIRFVARREGSLPMIFVAVIGFGKAPGPIRVEEGADRVTVQFAGGTVAFDSNGLQVADA